MKRCNSNVESAFSCTGSFVPQIGYQYKFRRHKRLVFFISTWFEYDRSLPVCAVASVAAFLLLGCFGEACNMIKERIDVCTACPGRLEQKGAYWVCRNCGAVYAIGKHYDGTVFSYPVAPSKELPFGQMAKRASQLSVGKITVKEIKPMRSLETDVYRESIDLDHNEHVKLITIFLKNGEWDVAQSRIYDLRNLNDPCSVAAAAWYEMACERHAHNDMELVRSFSDITDAELAQLDAIIPYATPDFRRRVLDFLLSYGYVGDAAVNGDSVKAVSLSASTAPWYWK